MPVIPIITQSRLSTYLVNANSLQLNPIPFVTSERLPLLPRSMDYNHASTSKSGSHADPSQSVAIVFPTAHAMAWPTAAQSIRSLGWTEYLLPDSSFYYANAGMRVITDIDLRNTKKLEAITEYLDRKLPEEVSLPPVGWELWLRDAGSQKNNFAPLRNWVNHKAKILSFDPPPSPSGEAETVPDHITDDDSMFIFSIPPIVLIVPFRTRYGIPVLGILGRPSCSRHVAREGSQRGHGRAYLVVHWYDCSLSYCFLILISVL